MLEKILADRIANTRLAHIAQALYSSIEISVMRFYNDPTLISLLKTVRREDHPLLFKPSELATLYYLAAAQTKVEGDYAEIGVYNGSSAKVICAAKAEKALHLFDTFNGIPTSDNIDERFSKNMFSTHEESVKKRLANYQQVYIYKGLFPLSAMPLKEKTFSFVHLDVDVYRSTVDALQFFYPRLTSFGIILTHDYSSAAGVKKAFDEFFQTKPEPIIQLPMSQALIIRR